MVIFVRIFRTVFYCTRQYKVEQSGNEIVRLDNLNIDALVNGALAFVIYNLDLPHL